MNISEELKKEIYFVIPAFNESTAIKGVLDSLLGNGYSKIIVVDDGSKDDTAEVVLNYENKGVILLQHVINRGQGAALQTGMDYAVSQGDCRYIVTFDSDGQHRIDDLPKFIRVLEKGEADIVLGSRFLTKSSRRKVPIKKRILLKGALLITLFFSSMILTDTHNGYRVMNKRAARKIEITLDGFEHASEILDQISEKKIPYKEVPVTIDYNDYATQKGQKITNSIKIAFKMIFRPGK